MANVLIEESTMSSIADSIRGKTGGSETMKPREMPAEIDSISTGGNKPDPDLPIRFFSYDGELLYSYSLEQLTELTTLPPVPDVTGLTSQGWNWTLQNLILNGREADVGPMYVTDDGATRIYISLKGERLTPYLGFHQSAANAVVVDWGDGSPTETSENTSPINMFHTYSECGSYVISLTPKNGATLSIRGTGSGFDYRSTLVYSNTDNSMLNAYYNSAVEKIELGRNISVGDGAFANLNAMKSITIPTSIILMGACSFFNCSSLKMLMIPLGIDVISDGFAYECKKLCYVSIPSSVSSIGANAFKECYSLERVSLSNTIETLGEAMLKECSAISAFHFPDSVTSVPYDFLNGARILKEVNYGNAQIEVIDGNAYNYCTSLDKIVIPETVTQIGASAYSVTACKFVYVYAETPPVLNNDPFNYCKDNSEFQIYVPNGCLETYKAAQKWSAYARKMQEMPE